MIYNGNKKNFMEKFIFNQTEIALITDGCGLAEKAEAAYDTIDSCCLISESVEIENDGDGDKDVSFSQNPKEITLKKKILKDLSYLTDDFIGIQNIDVGVSNHISFFTDEIGVRIKIALIGTDIKEESHTFKIKYPQNWFEHFKQDIFPSWLLKRFFPVKYSEETKIVTFNQEAIFPHTVLKLGKETMVIHKCENTEIKEGIIDE